MMKIAAACLLCLSLSAPAYAQQSEERRNTEAKATFFLWTGIGVASAGILPMAYGAPSVGVPFMLGGGGLIYYAFHLNNKAKQMPSTTFVVAPLKKGVAVGVTRSW
jgi:hypothetical protein